MSDVKHEGDAPAEAGPPAPTEKLSPKGISAMQGKPEPVTSNVGEPTTEAGAKLEARSDAVAVKEKSPVDVTPHGQAAMQEMSDSQLAVQLEPQKPPTDTRDVKLIGDPERDARFCKEQHGNTCAVEAQRGILEKHTGHDPGDLVLIEEAREMDGLGPDGMPPDRVGDMLERHGIPVNKEYTHDLDRLRNELEQGHDAIVGVNAAELYQFDPGSETPPGHALWVTGMALDAKGNPLGVYVNDSNPVPGGFGPCGFIPIDTFQRAWAAPSGGLLVVTQKAAGAA